jgi:transcription antitermination factor NusG
LGDWGSNGGSLAERCASSPRDNSSEQSGENKEMQNGEISHPWFALQVRSRYENIVTAHLEDRGYEWFLPQYRIRKRWSDRFKEFDRPLFPGYLFCRLNPLNRLPILTIPGVVLIVGTSKAPIPVDETEIAAIQAAVKSGLPSQPVQFLRIGQKVRMNYGPLCGLEGILLSFRGRDHLVLSVTILQRSVAVQVENSAVTSIPQTAWADPKPSMGFQT